MVLLIVHARVMHGVHVGAMAATAAQRRTRAQAVGGGAPRVVHGHARVVQVVAGGASRVPVAVDGYGTEAWC